jgi:hypothetical protein
VQAPGRPMRVHFREESGAPGAEPGVSGVRQLHT